MPTSEQLYLRALRMLADGLQHSAAAMAWALSAAGRLGEAQLPTEREHADGFSLRELSLGASPWW